MEEWQLLTSAMEIDLALFFFFFFGGGFLKGSTQLSAESPDGTQLHFLQNATLHLPNKPIW